MRDARDPGYRRDMQALERIARGAAAGAAGTTALNAVTYLDMAGRGRSSSRTPEQTIEKLAAKAHITIPGGKDAQRNRISGLGALNGIAAGVGGGAAIAALHTPKGGLSVAGTGVLAAVAVMALTNGSMAALGITDPREWSAGDWVSDLIPHLAYGLVTAAALKAMTGTEG